MEEKINANLLIANKINKYLKENGITVEFINKKTEVNWYHRLNGRTSIKVEELVDLANALNIDVSEFLN